MSLHPDIGESPSDGNLAYLRIENGNFTLEGVRRLDDLNSLLLAFHSFQTLGAQYKGQLFPQPDLKDKLEAAKKDKDKHLLLLDDIRIIMSGDYSTPQKASEIKQAKKTIIDFSEASPGETPLTVTIQKEDDIEDIIDTMGGIIRHDLAIKLTTLEYLDLLGSKNLYGEEVESIEQIAKHADEGFTSLYGFITETVPLIILERNPHDDIPLEEISQILKKKLPVARVADNPKLADLAIDYSSAFFIELVDNLASNFLKSFQEKALKGVRPKQINKVDVYFVLLKDVPALLTEEENSRLAGGKEYVVIVFDDNGIGFGVEDEQLIREGYKEGVSNYQSRGVVSGSGKGMAWNQRKIELYGGTIALRRKEEGVRQLVVLPLKT